MVWATIRDENLSAHLKQVLNEMGFDTDTVSDKGLSGKNDADIGIAVQDTNRMLFSLDLDFADVRRFPPGEHAGIVERKF